MKNYLLPCLLLAVVFLTNACKDDEMPGEPVTTIARLSVVDISKFEGDEGETTFTFKVRLDKALETTVSVDYATADFTGVSGEDYTPVNGTLSFAPDETEQRVDVLVQTDTLKEADDQFKLVISNPSGAAIASAEGIGTIRNDDTFQVIPDDGYITPISYPGWTTFWTDEFDGNVLDPNAWTYETGNGDWGWGNNELQYYREGNNNTTLNDGKLIIEAKKESFGSQEYTSARIITKDKIEFMHGRVDIRAKLPEGQGIWPALWMLGANINQAGWPACGEIDIMELVGHEPGTVHSTIHYGSSNSDHQYTGKDKSLPGGEKFSEKFHVFSLLWQNNSMTFLMDDEEVVSYNASQINGNYPFNQPFFFIFNIAVGGNWPGEPNASTVFPQQMVIDYIRVFQQ